MTTLLVLWHINCVLCLLCKKLKLFYCLSGQYGEYCLYCMERRHSSSGRCRWKPQFLGPKGPSFKVQMYISNMSCMCVNWLNSKTWWTTFLARHIIRVWVGKLQLCASHTRVAFTVLIKCHTHLYFSGVYLHTAGGWRRFVLLQAKETKNSWWCTQMELRSGIPKRCVCVCCLFI